MGIVRSMSHTARFVLATACCTPYVTPPVASNGTAGRELHNYIPQMLKVTEDSYGRRISTSLRPIHTSRPTQINPKRAFLHIMAAGTKSNAGKAIKKNQKVTKKYIINATQPTQDRIFDPSAFATFLQQRIKVEGRTGNLGENITVNNLGDGKIEVVAHQEFSGRYLKYLTKKFLKKQQLRDWLRVVSTSKGEYSLKFFNVGGLLLLAQSLPFQVTNATSRPDRVCSLSFSRGCVELVCTPSPISASSPGLSRSPQRLLGISIEGDDRPSGPWQAHARPAWSRCRPWASPFTPPPFALRHVGRKRGEKGQKSPRSAVYTSVEAPKQGHGIGRYVRHHPTYLPMDRGNGLGGCVSPYGTLGHVSVRPAHTVHRCEVRVALGPGCWMEGGEARRGGESDFFYMLYAPRAGDRGLGWVGRGRRPGVGRREAPGGRMKGEGVKG
nr:60s ribosomal protein l22 [Quercus suber]